MTRKTLTIEYDSAQEFFNTDDGGSLFEYLTNEFDNKGIVAWVEEGDTVRLDREVAQARQCLEALQDAVAQFNDNFKHAVLTGRKVDYAPPPPWLPPLVRDLNAALAASKVS